MITFILSFIAIYLATTSGIAFLMVLYARLHKKTFSHLSNNTNTAIILGFSWVVIPILVINLLASTAEELLS